jgi:hypothetical protein
MGRFPKGFSFQGGTPPMEKFTLVKFTQFPPEIHEMRHGNLKNNLKNAVSARFSMQKTPQEKVEREGQSSIV